MIKQQACRKPHFLAILLLLIVLLLALPQPALAAEGGRTMILVNKQHALSSRYQPDDLVYLSNYTSANGGVMMKREAAEALRDMLNAAKEDGISDILGLSGYRSYSVQKQLHSNKTAVYRSEGMSQGEAEEWAATVVARPGQSEHQLGLAIDVGSPENGYALSENFADTKAGQWLAENCWKYGYILRYPEGKTSITGYIYEPWHFRYVGLPHSEHIYQLDITLDQYYELIVESGFIHYTDLAGEGYDIYYSVYPELDGVALENASISTAAARVGGYIITLRNDGVAPDSAYGKWQLDKVCKLAAQCLREAKVPEHLHLQRLLSCELHDYLMQQAEQGLLVEEEELRGVAVVALQEMMEGEPKLL